MIEDRPDEVTGSAGSFVSSNFESASSPPPSASETSRSVADASVEIFISDFWRFSGPVVDALGIGPRLLSDLRVLVGKSIDTPAISLRRFPERKHVLRHVF